MELAFLGNGYADTYHIDGDLYSDNTPFIKSVWNDGSPYAPDRIVMSVFDTGQFHSAMMLGHYLRSTWSHTDLWLYIPYFPGARQDRSNPTGDLLFAAKYYADIVNGVGFDKVVIVDPHSLVTPALLDNVHVLSISDLLWGERYNDELWPSLKNYAGIIAPDSGSYGRASDVAQFFQVPLYQGFKHRDPSNGKISGFGIAGEIPAGHYLMVDDICDGGGTFIGLDNVLPDGVECDLWVTHGIFSQGTRELLKHFGVIFTTNSLGQYHSNVRVLDIREVVFDNDII